MSEAIVAELDLLIITMHILHTCRSIAIGNGRELSITKCGEYGKPLNVKLLGINLIPCLVNQTQIDNADFCGIVYAHMLVKHTCNKINVAECWSLVSKIYRPRHCIT